MRCANLKTTEHSKYIPRYILILTKYEATGVLLVYWPSIRYCTKYILLSKLRCCCLKFCFVNRVKKQTCCFRNVSKMTGTFEVLYQLLVTLSLTFQKIVCFTFMNWKINVRPFPNHHNHLSTKDKIYFCFKKMEDQKHVVVCHPSEISSIYSTQCSRKKLQNETNI